MNINHIHVRSESFWTPFFTKRIRKALFKIHVDLYAIPHLGPQN
jgi:hypothetical protein